MQSGLGQIPRGISIARTAYSIVNQLHPNGPAHSIAWYSTDTPATGVFVPFFALSTQQHAQYRSGVNRKFSRDSAWWAFNAVSNFAAKVNWNMASERDVLPLQNKLQNKLLAEAGEAAALGERGDVEGLNAWQSARQGEVAERWWALWESLLVK